MKKWAIQLTLHFEMESNKKWGPLGDEAIKEITKRIPTLDPSQLEFEYSEALE